jgi:hypothetical protein
MIVVPVDRRCRVVRRLPSLGERLAHRFLRSRSLSGRSGPFVEETVCTVDYGTAAEEATAEFAAGVRSCFADTPKSCGW